MQQTETGLEELNRLIDSAKARAGNDTKLAKMLNTTSSRVSDWRHGRKTCQPEDQAVLASIAGMNAIEVLARATVKQHEGTPKGDLLMRALGKGFVATGAAIGSVGASAAETFSSIPTPSNWAGWTLAGLYTMYRKVKLKHPFRSINFITSAPV